jgi:hypothetical protein
LHEKEVETAKHKGKTKRKNPQLSPSNKEAFHSFGTALLLSITKIGTQSTMKSSI